MLATSFMVGSRVLQPRHLRPQIARGIAGSLRRAPADLGFHAAFVMNAQVAVDCTPCPSVLKEEPFF